jgi:paraquat-inducible protein A
MERVACPDCDLLHGAISLRAGEAARCARCGTTLDLSPTQDDGQSSVAILATAGVAFAIAVSTPLMRLSAMGRDAEASLPTSAAALWMTGSPASAVLVALFTMALPAAYLALALAACIGALRSPVPRWASVAALWARRVTPWSMPEVMLLATLVAYVKVSELADAAPGLGMYALGVLAIMLVLGRNATETPGLRRSAPAPVPAPSSVLARIKALLMAAAICYVPANVLPVLVTNTPEGVEAQTILDGVQALQRSGSWGLALIVVVASVVIPIAKVGVLAYLCAVVEHGIPASARECARLFRLVEAVGRWAMLDVFVDAFVVALVQLPPVMWERPGPGVPFFAATAVFTMLAALSFDPRLLWSARERVNGHG